jgi:ribosomal-protein-alanine N-acetyltransferase
LRYGFELIDRIVFLEVECLPTESAQEAEPALRPIRPNDVAKLANLDRLSFGDLWRYDLGNFMELLVTTSHAVIAEASGAVVGYAISDTVNGDGYLIRIAVHPDHRLRGVGSRLLSDCLNHCRSCGASKVILNTQESNAASLRLYHSFGFQRFGRRVPVLVREL